MYDITDDTVLSQSGAGERSNLPRRISLAGSKREGSHKGRANVCVCMCVCASHLGQSERSVAEKVGCHHQGSDRGQVFTKDEEV